MGARGGAVLVRVWRCSTCGRLYDRDRGGREAAVECCNDAVADAKQKAEDRSVKKALASVAAPRTRLCFSGRKQYIEATAKCPRARCRHTNRVTVEVGGYRSYGPALTRVEAKSKASALARAQIARHLRGWTH